MNLFYYQRVNKIFLSMAKNNLFGSGFAALWTNENVQK
jgi:hypothetical protein